MERITIQRGLGFAAAFALASAPAASALAAGLVPCGNEANDMCTWEDVIGFANSFLTYLIGIAVTIAGVLIAWAGVKILMARGDPKAMIAARNQLSNIVIGMAVMILAFTIIKVLLTTFGVQSKFRAPGL